MEKRLVLFLVVSLAIMVGYNLLHATFFAQPARGPADQAAAPLADGPEPAKQPQPPAGDKAAAPAESEAVAADQGTADAEQPLAVDDDAPQQYPNQRWTLGSMDPDSPFAMLVTFNTRGASIERAELNSPKYQELEEDSGYLGNLGFVETRTGLQITVVGPGTPAARAVADEAGVEPGLRGPTYVTDEQGLPQQQAAGDTIVALDGKPVHTVDELDQLLQKTRPNQVVTIEVDRATSEGDVKRLKYSVTLGEHPLEVMRPEAQFTPADKAARHPLSFLTTLHEIDGHTAEIDEDEIRGLASLYTENWAAKPLQDDGETGAGIEFRRMVTSSELQQLGISGSLEIVKRFRLGKRPGAEDDAAGRVSDPYCLEMELEIHNRSDKTRRVGYRIQGPTGLPLEGWWYSNKVHPSKWFSSTGARDVVWRSPRDRHELISCSKITEQIVESPDNPNIDLTADTSTPQLTYIGSDAQFFSVALQPVTSAEGKDPFTKPTNALMRKMFARAVGPPDQKSRKRTEVTFLVDSLAVEVPPGEALRHRYTIFAGPKDPEVLGELGLSDFISYGLFGRVARPMVWLLHQFYRFTRNYGIAIVLLTVLVRGALFPLGRKMALNAQKMQELAPEIKKIADKYKNDLEKRTQAQRELFAKHNYNPFSGCLVMLFQIPIFIGLYRGLSVDVALRQAPLIPGLKWCSNLAGPDMFVYWEDFMPGFIADRTGWLGPYLNILPVITVILFLVHQKLFTPPATDEQQRMQQQIMKFMMLFMGVMFHKVASGLCIYFIASSLWGLAERLLLPKHTPATVLSGAGAEGKTAAPARTESNGAAAARKRRKQRRG